jgi:hypothetical protein
MSLPNFLAPSLKAKLPTGNELREFQKDIANWTVP